MSFAPELVCNDGTLELGMRVLGWDPARVAGSVATDSSDDYQEDDYPPPDDWVRGYFLGIY